MRPIISRYSGSKASARSATAVLVSKGDSIVMPSEVETSLTISVAASAVGKHLEIELVRLPTHSPLPSRLRRPCRSSHSLHSSTERVLSEVEGLGMTAIVVASLCEALRRPEGDVYRK